MAVRKQSQYHGGQANREFHGWILAEPAKPHFTWNLSWKAGGVFHARNENVSPDLG
jgi:hypothetical protein